MPLAILLAQARDYAAHAPRPRESTARRRAAAAAGRVERVGLGSRGVAHRAPAAGAFAALRLAGRPRVCTTPPRPAGDGAGSSPEPRRCRGGRGGRAAAGPHRAPPAGKPWPAACCRQRTAVLPVDHRQPLRPQVISRPRAQPVGLLLIWDTTRADQICSRGYDRAIIAPLAQLAERATWETAFGVGVHTVLARLDASPIAAVAARHDATAPGRHGRERCQPAAGGRLPHGRSWARPCWPPAAASSAASRCTTTRSTRRCATATCGR